MNNKFNRNFKNNFQKTGKYYFTNYKIEEQKLRVVASDGSLIGIISKDEALKMAQELGLDLVLIAKNATPPVAKITDFKKFLYEQEKKEKEAKKGAKKSTVKDVQISLFIGPADLQRIIDKTKEFLQDGNQVRLNLTLKGREVTRKDKALELANAFILNLGEVVVSKEPRLEGRVVRAVLTKKK